MAVRNLRYDRRRRVGATTGPQHRRVDTGVIAAACVISVLAYLHFYRGGATIAYGDAKSHLLIARRVLFADTPGAGQLGGVWLPLPHILMLPLIWNNWAYYSGFAGSVVMMLEVIRKTLVRRRVRRLTGARLRCCDNAVLPSAKYAERGARRTDHCGTGQRVA